MNSESSPHLPLCCGISCMTQREEERHPLLRWAGGLSDVSEGCTTRLLLLTSGYPSANTQLTVHVSPHTLSGQTHTTLLWIGLNNWSQCRDIIHPQRVSCHCWQADINIPPPPHQGLMAVHQAAMRHTNSPWPGVYTQCWHFRWNREMGENKGGQHATWRRTE